MGCFAKYYNEVSARPYWTVMDDLDSAVSLVGCVRGGIHGSGPLYHGVDSAESFTESEKAEATALADTVRKHAKSEPGQHFNSEHSDLADAAYTFAVACLVRRGAIHRGEPKIPSKSEKKSANA